MTSNYIYIGEDDDSFITKYHIKVLEGDNIEILCTLASMSGGNAYYNLDEILQLNGKSITKFNTSKTSTSTAKKTNTNENSAVKTSAKKSSSTVNNTSSTKGNTKEAASRQSEQNKRGAGGYYTSDADKVGATCNYVVINSPSDGYANIRYQPSIDSDIKYQWKNGAILDYLDETIDTPDGRHWYYVGFYYWDDYEGEGQPRYMDGYISSKVCDIVT